ncbi:glycosyl hydrolase family 28-related protein [Streptomyces sp. NPDC058308]|uniref:glycosyl hydrolase family 28-related protein n=1 Tax=Streptomyces sp. NPDC058308 TaxID=3346440 RepID=UPI0036E1236B
MKTAVVAVDVQAGDVLCSALDPKVPETLTKATSAALTAGTMVTGVAATAAAAGSTVSYYAQPEVVPSGIAGLGAGPSSAVVADERGRCARQLPVVRGAFVVGECDAQGNVTVAPKHDFANVLDFGAKGDDQSDDWDAITRAMRSLHPLQPGVVYFPAGYYRIGRPLVVDRQDGKIELLGESEHTTTIRFFGGHGPALCISSKSLGHLPTGDALLAGNGRAGALSAGNRSTINLRDSPALDMDGAPSFSVSCTVRPEVLPGLGGSEPVISSSGRRLDSEPATCAFGIFLSDSTTGQIKVTATARLNGVDYPITHPDSFPVGQTFHLSLVWDGKHLDLYAGPPGTVLTPAEPREGQRPPVGAKLTQPVEEGVYLGARSQQRWPEYYDLTRPFTGRVDSVRISDFVVDRNADTRALTAPTAKFPADFATNVRPDPAHADKRLVTRMLINFDRDVDAFTVGSTWVRATADPAPVYLMYQWSGPPTGAALTTVRRLEFQCPLGTGIHAQLTTSSVFSHIRATAVRDGVRLRNNSYLCEIEHLYINATRLGLTLGGSALARINRLQVIGTQYDFVATDVVGVTARDWYIGSYRSIVPLLLTTAAPYGTFHGIGVTITSEGTQGFPETWQAAVATSDLHHFVLESSVLETGFLKNSDCPPVIIDNSRLLVAQKPPKPPLEIPTASTFVNCEFRPSESTRANIVFSGLRGPTPVRIIGSTTNPEKPWTLPQDENMVSHLGGCVSTTDRGQTQWQGGRDWVFALDAATGRIGARERETQGSGVAAASPVRLAGVPLAAGASRYRAEVMATDATGRAATWVVEQGLSNIGGTVTPWAPKTRVLDSFGTAEGSVPAGWNPPQIVPLDSNAVVECSAPQGLRLAYTVKLQAVEGLGAS